MANRKANGEIFLIPSELGPDSNTIPEYVRQIVFKLDTFVVENERSARRFLRKIGYTKDFEEVELMVLNKHTEFTTLSSMLLKCKEGKDIGIISEAGCPAIADPGAELVSLAHQENLKVSPLVGPSSILLALIGSGLNGQSFCFHGYLPVDSKERIKAILQLEQSARSQKQTQLFMETPYRNDKLIEDILAKCRPDTLFTIAANITTQKEWIKTMEIQQWKKKKIKLHKQPAIFLLGTC